MTEQGLGPRRAGEVRVGDDSEGTLACRDVTGVDCDFVAMRDVSPQGAGYADTIDQFLAQLSTHVAVSHPGHGLGPEQLRDLRAQHSPQH